jgi:hypothetical protein
LPFGVVDLLQMSVVANVFNLSLQWQYFVVARHDRDNAELESLGQVHRGDVHAARSDVNSFVEYTQPMKRARTPAWSDGLLVVDYGTSGRDLGIEITAPQAVSLERPN